MEACGPHCEILSEGGDKTGVKAAVGVYKEHGVFYCGDVKTATALFPKKELSRLLRNSEHGDCAVMRAQVPIDERRNLTLYAIGQKRGPTVHTFISTFGMFTPPPKEAP